MGPDEPREAEIARELVASGDWVVPRLNAVPFLEKPPLAYWGPALVFGALGGPSEEWCRLPSALWAALGTAACAWLGAMLFGRRVGVMAALVLATCREWLLDAHTLLVDTPLAAGVAGAFALFWYGYGAVVPRRKAASYLMATAACGVAFMAKGPIGVALPPVGVLAFLAWRREWRELLRLFAPINLAAFAALAVPWLAMVRVRGGPTAFHTLFFDNMVVRFFSGSADHAGPPWAYALSIFGVMLPWSLLIPPVIAALARRGRPETGDGLRRWEFRVAITAGPLLLLSLASAKRPVYLLPLLPAFAIAIAAWLDGSLDQDEARWQRIWRAAGTFVLGLVALAGWGVSVVLAVRERGGLQAAVLGLAVALSAAVAFSRSTFRGKRTDLPAFAAGFAFLICLSLLSSSTFRALESRRGYQTLTAALSHVAGPGTRVYGYGMGERELGVVCFQQGVTVPQVNGPEQLRRVLEDGAAVVLIKSEIVTTLRASGEWPSSAEVVAAPVMPSRPFVLVRRKPK